MGAAIRGLRKKGDVKKLKFYSSYALNDESCHCEPVRAWQSPAPALKICTAYQEIPTVAALPRNDMVVVPWFFSTNPSQKR